MTNYVEWYCPECGKRDRTPPLGAGATRMHICPKLAMLATPMVPEGIKARIIAKDRDDYVGREAVQTNADGRPVMSIVTERADGSNDVRVLAPTARASMRGST